MGHNSADHITNYIVLPTRKSYNTTLCTLFVCLFVQSPENVYVFALPEVNDSIYNVFSTGRCWKRILQLAFQRKGRLSAANWTKVHTFFVSQ